MGLLETYHYLNVDIADPRVSDWFLMSNPIPIILIVGIYLLFVLFLGPQIMANRRPHELYEVMIFYNISIAIASGIIFYGLLTSWFTTSLSWGCEPVDPSYKPEAIKMAGWVWRLLLLKIAELGDTIIFVLRKKFSQCTFLHIYHHAATLIIAWIACKYVPGGMWTFVMLPNCLVHVIMYTYYLLTALGPNIQKKLNSYKPYLTRLQMMQFLIMFAHTTQALMPSCEPRRKPLAFLYMFHVLVTSYLFWDFYKKSYLRKKIV